MVFCTQPAIIQDKHSGLLMGWKTLRGPIELVTLLLFQLRIAMTAMTLRLKLARTRRSRVASAAVQRDPNQERMDLIVVRVAWSSLRASMVVLVSSVLLNVNMFGVAMNATVYRRHPRLVLVFNLLPALQQMYSPLIYLCFFAPFRRVAFQWCGRLHCGLVRGRCHRLERVAPRAP